jgi:hypothetical protein
VPSKDPERRRQTNAAAQRRYYARNSKKYRLYADSAKARNLEWVREFKRSKGCFRCGETDPLVLDLHHLHSKVLEVSAAARSGWSIDRISSEAEKCLVLCANCHRREHGIEREQPSGSARSDKRPLW